MKLYNKRQNFLKIKLTKEVFMKSSQKQQSSFWSKTIIYSFLLSLLASIACQPPSQQDYELNILKSEGLSPEDHLALLPNPLFTAVYDQQKEENLKDIIDTNGEYLLEVNQDGDSPLGLAIKFDKKDLALFLAKQLDPEQYTHQNHKGESYLYLASKKGFVELIQFLSIQFWIWNRDLFKDHEFKNLDLKTTEGEKALHVAKNSALAETLRTEYRRGALEYPFRRFLFYRNHLDQTFLHTAVRDQNDDLLRWGLEKACSSFEELSFARKMLVNVWESVQKFGRHVGLDWDNLINTQDKMGMTALNFAAKSKNLSAIDILSSCAWNNYRLKDLEGNIPLHNFLLSLDPLKKEQDQTTKEIFLKLMQSETLLSWTGGIAKTIDIPNNNGNTSLHISANLNDPFFYNELKKYGHVEIKNHEQKTPREIFNARQKQSHF